MEIILKRKFIKEAGKLPSKVQKSIRDIIDTLERSESLETSGVDYIAMEGQLKGDNYYRIRVGQWRIGIQYVEPSLIFITVLSRGDVYKKFPPK